MRSPLTPLCTFSRANSLDGVYERCMTLSSSNAASRNLKEDVAAKYWSQRFRLFKKWHLGVRLDEIAWFSVTPEAIAEHHAARCSLRLPSDGVKHSPTFILDAFCGAGGNAIQFALSSMNVLTFDNRLQTIELARHNARVYNVGDKINFVCGDVVTSFPTIVVDVIFLSPPWGGPSYKNDIYQLKELRVSHIDGLQLLKCALQVTQNVAFYLPRNVSLRDVIDLGVPFEVEKNFLNGKLKAVTLYFGDLITSAFEGKEFRVQTKAILR